MKRNLTSILSLTALCLAPATFIWSAPEDALTPAVVSQTAESVPISQEFSTVAGYSGGSQMKQGTANLGDVDNTYTRLNYVASPQIKEGILLRMGVDWERNSFGLFDNAPLPNTLQSVNAIIGADFVVSDQILLRAELHPGIYSDFVNVSSSDFDMPVQFGGTYLWSKDFQIIFGIQIDLKSSYPIIGLPGFRWHFADKWVLSAIPPKPQLQYEFSKALTLYVGADITGGTYHLNDSFGSSHGHGPGNNASQLNGNICEYTEIRVGAGFTWKFIPNMSLDVSGGYMPFRQFSMHEDSIGFNPDCTTFRNDVGKGAPYGQIGLNGSF